MTGEPFDEKMIESAVEEAVSARKRMREQHIIVRDAETEAKLDDVDAYMACKNSEQRQLFMDSALRDDEGYHEARFQHDEARADLKIAMLRIKGCELRVAYLAATRGA